VAVSPPFFALRSLGGARLRRGRGGNNNKIKNMPYSRKSPFIRRGRVGFQGKVGVVE
jgi:hypothetical protein